MGKKINALRKQVKSLERQLDEVKARVAQLHSPGKAKGKSPKAGKGKTKARAVVKAGQGKRKKVAGKAAAPEPMAEDTASAGAAS